jgi:hypothetical protein
MFRGCCGSPPPRRRREPPSQLPSNPQVSDGVRLLYLGSGFQKIRVHEHEYYVSDHRRYFVCDSKDSGVLLRRFDVILAPERS